MGTDQLQRYLVQHLSGALSSTTFDQYIAFLIRTRLIEQPDPNVGHYFIGENGTYFLTYIAQQGLLPKEF